VPVFFVYEEAGEGEKLNLIARNSNLPVPSLSVNSMKLSPRAIPAGGCYLLTEIDEDTA